MWSQFDDWLKSRNGTLGPLLIFITLLISGFVLWAIAIYIWRMLYDWFAWVTEPSFILTFFVIPLPYFAFMAFVNATRREKPSVPPKDWLMWLGNDDPNNGTLVLFIFLFWSLSYWNWPGIEVDATTISVWGLVTIFGLYLIRATLFRKPSKEVSAPETSKR